MEDRAAYHVGTAGQQTVESSSGAHAGSDAPRPSTGSADSRARPKAAQTVTGLTFPRFFTDADPVRVDPFDEIEWELRHAVIGSERGDVVFEQRDVEVPKAWSQQATNIVVSKYFRGQIGTPERERSVKQLIGRVVATPKDWARVQKYFATAAELE